MKRSSLDLLGLIDATLYAVGAACGETGAWAKIGSATNRVVIPTVRDIDSAVTTFKLYYYDGCVTAGVYRETHPRYCPKR